STTITAPTTTFTTITAPTTTSTTTAPTTTSTTTTAPATTSTTTTAPTTTSTTTTEVTTRKEREVEITELTTTETETTTTTTKTTTITTTEASTTTEKLTTNTTVTNIASDEELCNWSVFDYNYKNSENNKNATIAVSAEITEKSDNQYLISIKDNSDNILDVYEINPENGIGTDSNSGEVNLPQTGNNSLTNIIIALAALMMTIAGFTAIKFSEIFRRKENE
ncbi:MAG: LPXTG cell wall anchor domain-containing protein, partial [Ruminococcus sp.]|nr:LPXTG cell wall anchor domain-containing protein [Ruminococcus sp.]